MDEIYHQCRNRERVRGKEWDCETCSKSKWVGKVRPSNNGPHPNHNARGPKRKKGRMQEIWLQ